jgi:hypothetical protein
MLKLLLDSFASFTFFPKQEEFEYKFSERFEKLRETKSYEEYLRDDLNNLALDFKSAISFYEKDSH